MKVLKVMQKTRRLLLSLLEEAVVEEAPLQLQLAEEAEVLGVFMNFGERKDPPHKGQKEVPEGASDCLAGLTFVISGTLDRDEAEDLIKSHGGRVTGSVSKKTNYLLCDEDIGGRKSSKAKELGTTFLTEDGLFDMIRASNHAKPPALESKKSMDSAVVSFPKKSPQKVETKSGK